MSTTIQVQEETLEMLKHFRQAAHANSYDQTITELIKKATQKQASMHGYLKRKMTMNEICKGLRDENDRF